VKRVCIELLTFHVRDSVEGSSYEELQDFVSECHDQHMSMSENTGLGWELSFLPVYSYHGGSFGRDFALRAVLTRARTVQEIENFELKERELEVLEAGIVEAETRINQLKSELAHYKE